MKPTGNKVYVYGILDDNDDIIYVGKSSKPYERLKRHISRYDRAVILDFYYDKESYWIDKLRLNGHILENKHTDAMTSEHKIGDILIRSYKLGRPLEESYEEQRQKVNIGQGRA